ncbi:hypothetical protein ACWOBH_10515, partial [Globicatella sanguinis]
CSHVISYFLLFLDNLIIEEITGFLYIKIVLVISPPTLKIIDPGNQGITNDWSFYVGVKLSFQLLTIESKDCS